jgi:alkanesulfonate monooxygenase SsuD/methylene tetrahydromethanopterin reductase-like flavin-dependent oxidoreductase (luciferase family)
VRIGILHEATARPGDTLTDLYRETLELIDAAEVAGIDFFGCSEQHFWPEIDGIPPIATISSPEVLYAMGIARTSRLVFRTAVSTLAYHHPLVMASRIATLDIVSGGRMEFGTGRGNSTLAADAFGIEVDEMYDRWHECISVIIGAWESQGAFEWNGRYFRIPPREITVKPLQKPYPPTYYAAFSPQSHERAGELGLGLMTSTAGVTIDKVAGRIELYRKALASATPIGSQVNDRVSLTLLGHCTPTAAQAREEGEQPFIDYFVSATAVYREMVGRVRPEVDFSGLRGQYTYDAMTATGMILSGDPDHWLNSLADLERMGVDDLAVNFVGIDHAAALKAIDLIGREVIPNLDRGAAPIDDEVEAQVRR